MLCSFTRNPKNIDGQLKDAMKLHVTGVIFHGRAKDEVHLFACGPNLKGDSNLNIECLYRAISTTFKDKGMLPKLHVQAIYMRSFLLTIDYNFL